MFALTYKAGWMQVHETWATFETKEAARAAVKGMVAELKASGQRKIWVISIVEV